MEYALDRFVMTDNKMLVVQGANSLYTYQHVSGSSVAIQGSNNAVEWVDIGELTSNGTLIKEHSYKYLKSVGAGTVLVNRGEGNNTNDSSGGSSTGGSVSNVIIDYNPADHVTVGDVAVENASVAVGWNGTELSVNGTPNTVMVNLGDTDPAKEVEYVAIKIPLPTTGSFEIDLTQLNGSMMQIHMSGVEQTLEQLIANYLLSQSSPYTFTSITATQANIGGVYKNTDFGDGNEGGSLTSMLKKAEIFTYLEFAAITGQDVSSFTPEQIAQYELLDVSLRVLSITDADTGGNMLVAPIDITNPYMYFTLVANYVTTSDTSVTLNPNAKLLINFDGIGSVGYELPDSAADGDYLKILGDVNLFGKELKEGDYIRLTNNKTNFVPLYGRYLPGPPPVPTTIPPVVESEFNKNKILWRRAVSAHTSIRLSGTNDRNPLLIGHDVHGNIFIRGMFVFEGVVTNAGLQGGTDYYLLCTMEASKESISGVNLNTNLGDKLACVGARAGNAPVDIWFVVGNTELGNYDFYLAVSGNFQINQPVSIPFQCIGANVEKAWEDGDPINDPDFQ